MKSCLITAIFLIFTVCDWSRGNPLPHIIGGGFDEDFQIYETPKEDEPPRWLRSAVSSLQKPRARKEAPTLPENLARLEDMQEMFKIIATETEPAAPILVHRYSEPAGIKLAGMETDNPFLRAKRDASSNCPVPDDLPQLVQELNSHLNSSQFLGLDPQQPASDPMPNQTGIVVNDPNCPNPTWWGTRSELSLRSTCPWVYVDLDLGENVFPRHVRDAQCVCEHCINSPVLGCKKLRQTVTVLVRQGCKDGVALMNRKQVTITVGCTCAAAEPAATAPPVGGPGGPPSTN